MKIDSTHWQNRLTALARKHGVVGASLAIAKDDITLTAVTGVLNLHSGQPVTADALFQVGSITKVWTATLMMQLVDEGLIDLDAPLVRYLPEFRIADPGISATVTTRQLLSHTSGIDGDLFLDTGRGDDALAKYVAAMASLTRVVPPARTMSYCNSGYSLMGHLVATLRGKTWEQVLQERLLKPLGLGTAGTLPEEALLHAAAVGHLQHAGAAEPFVSPRWSLDRSAGPAGLLHSTAAQQLLFARMHLDGGLAADGTRLLSEASVQAMLVPQVEIPDRWLLGSHWGLGWILNHWGDQPVHGHDGTTFGQNGFLRILPRSRLSICLLSNGGKSPRGLFHELFSEIASDLAGVAPPAMPEVRPEQPIDASRYVGRYWREGVEVIIDEHEGSLRMTQIPKPFPGMPIVNPIFTLRPHSESVLIMCAQGEETGAPVVFFDLDGQRFMHFGARTVARAAD